MWLQNAPHPHPRHCGAGSWIPGRGIRSSSPGPTPNLVPSLWAVWKESRPFSKAAGRPKQRERERESPQAEIVCWGVVRVWGRWGGWGEVGCRAVSDESRAESRLPEGGVDIYFVGAKTVRGQTGIQAALEGSDRGWGSQDNGAPPEPWETCTPQPTGSLAGRHPWPLMS